MGSLLPLDLTRRPTLQRVVVLYRLDPGAVQDVLPADLRPRTVSGHALCEIRYSHLGSSPLLPRGLSSGADHLSYRFPVHVAGRGEPRPGTWILRRGSSSWLEATCGERLLRTDYDRASFTCLDTPHRLELSVRTGAGTELELRAVPTRSTPSRLFPSARALSEFSADEGALRPRSPFPQRRPPLGGRATVPEALVALGLRSLLFEAESPFPRGSAEFDSAWRFVDRQVAFVRSPAVPCTDRSRLVPAT